jgi:formylglycine-generating enzyme required for sulfatase activity
MRIWLPACLAILTVALGIIGDAATRSGRENPAVVPGKVRLPAIEMIPIPAGSFCMGSSSPVAEPQEKPAHVVSVGAFFMAKFEVTRGQWQAVMGGTSPAPPERDDLPIHGVSWNECQDFIRRLNARTGRRYRLPTEAEWEYACRAGTTGERYGDLDAIAWYVDNAGDSPHPVGRKRPNPWGLYDMLGNVWEWCQDLYPPYPGSEKPRHTRVTYGCGPVLRGGCWGCFEQVVRASYRFGIDPRAHNESVGLRLAMDDVPAPEND